MLSGIASLGVKCATGLIFDDGSTAWAGIRHRSGGSCDEVQPPWVGARSRALTSPTRSWFGTWSGRRYIGVKVTVDGPRWTACHVLAQRRVPSLSPGRMRATVHLGLTETLDAMKRSLARILRARAPMKGLEQDFEARWMRSSGAAAPRSWRSRAPSIAPDRGLVERDGERLQEPAAAPGGCKASDHDCRLQDRRDAASTTCGFCASGIGVERRRVRLSDPILHVMVRALKRHSVANVCRRDAVDRLSASVLLTPS